MNNYFKMFNNLASKDQQKSPGFQRDRKPLFDNSEFNFSNLGSQLGNNKKSNNITKNLKGYTTMNSREKSPIKLVEALGPCDKSISSKKITSSHMSTSIVKEGSNENKTLQDQQK